MSAVLTLPPAVVPAPRVWTVEQFHRLADLGWFEGRGAMLVAGVIREEGPMTPPHAIALELTTDAVRAAFGPGWRVRVQMPLVLNPDTDPEPDVAVVAGSARGADGHPTTAALVVEVADTSIRFDTATKPAWYAAAAVPDYWVLDVNARELTVFRDPAPHPAGGFAYRSRVAFGPADRVSPLAAPAAGLLVADLLP